MLVQRGSGHEKGGICYGQNLLISTGERFTIPSWQKLGALGDDILKVVILAGGLGTRLREETDFVPKPMVEIGHRPILWHIMKIYSHYGFNDFILCLGYKGDAIRNYLLQYDLSNTDFTIDLGTKEIIRHAVLHDERSWRVTLAETGLHTQTGGRVKRIANYIDEETFMLTYGDGVGDVDIAAVLDFHRRVGRIATVTGVRPVARFGELQVSGDLVQSFREKPQVEEGWINGGFFVFSRRVFDYIEADDTVLEGETLARLATEKQLAVYRHSGYWRCLDTVRDLQFLNQEWASRNAPWAVWEKHPVGRGAK
jgi:glucose-1-phosphate cytidylyltransferase